MVPLKIWTFSPRRKSCCRTSPTYHGCRSGGSENVRPAKDEHHLVGAQPGEGLVGAVIQSLSVVFLFQSFVEHLLSELYGQDSEPVLALEEPETHLHPQAARTPWQQIA